METLYLASKIKHAKRWRELKSLGYKIISTWIHVSNPTSIADKMSLAALCISEAARADRTILYLEAGETPKGALMEMGAALANHKPVYLVGTADLENSAFLHHPLCRLVATIEEALP